MERDGVTDALATTRSGRGVRELGRVGASVRVADRQIWFGKPTGRNGRVRAGLRSGGQDGSGGSGVAPISAPRPLRPQTRTEAPARRFMDSRPYTASWRECRSSSISPAAVIASSWFVRCFLARESSPESVEVGALLEAADDMNCSRGPHRQWGGCTQTVDVRAWGARGCDRSNSRGIGEYYQDEQILCCAEINKVQTRRAPPRRSVLRGATRGSVYPASRPVPARVRLDASFSARALVSPASATADGPSFSPPT